MGIPFPLFISDKIHVTAFSTRATGVTHELWNVIKKDTGHSRDVKTMPFSCQKTYSKT